MQLLDFKKKVVAIFLFTFIVIEITNLFSITIDYEWKWGIERNNSMNYFFTELTPAFKNNYFSTKIELPVYVASNFRVVNTQEWKFNTINDVYSKIIYFTVNPFKSFSFSIKRIEDYSENNQELFFHYNNILEYPVKKYLDFTFNYDIKNFYINFLANNLYSINFLNFLFFYKNAKSKSGVSFLYFQNNDKVGNIFYNRDIIKKKKVELKINNNIIYIMTSNNYSIKLTPALNLRYKCLTISVKARFNLSKNNIERFITPFYLNDNAVFDSVIKGGMNISYNFFNIIKFSNEILIKEKGVDNYFLLRNGKDFFSIINFNIYVYNRNINNMKEVFADRDRDSFIKLLYSIPLSKNLFFNFSYSKYLVNDSPIRISRLYTEFKF